MPSHAGRSAFLAGAADLGFDVSADILQKLTIYADLLIRWNARINLVGRSTLSDIWTRHFLDSAQLLPHLPKEPHILADLGSGAGFPGLVIALMRPDIAVHPIDSDQRKCAFLREAARHVGVEIRLHARRIADLNGLQADIVTARAFARLDKLLTAAESISGPDTKYVLLKGRDIDVELTGAAKCWNMRATRFPSIVENAGSVLVLDQVRRLAGRGHEET